MDKDVVLLICFFISVLTGGFAIFAGKISVGRYIALLGATLAVCSFSYFIFDAAYTSKTEYWGSWATQAEYYEEWDERVTCRHDVYCTRLETYPCGDSKKPSTCTRTVNYVCGKAHSYDVDNHPPYWQLVSASGDRFDINDVQFSQYVSRWKNKKFVELNRRYHSNDGDAYVTYWDNTVENFQPVTTAHLYENKVPVSSSVFYKGEVDEQTRIKFGVYNYPDIANFYQPAVLAPPELKQYALENEYTIQYLKTLAQKKQVTVFVLLFLNKSIDAANYQEIHWVNGNKNELDICIGIDDNKQVQWTKTIAWKNEGLKYDIDQYFLENKSLDLVNFGKWLNPAVEQNWQRMSFKELNESLTINYPTLLTFALMLLTCTIDIVVIFFEDIAKKFEFRGGY